jgi:hypothetical protein
MATVFDQDLPSGLQKMASGTQFNEHGPFNFFLREFSGVDLIFLATGTGIAPVKAMLESFEGRAYRISGELTNTDRIMNDTLWIGVYPGLSEEMLSFVVEKIEAFFGVNF